jgi:diaminopimelate epimerase
MGPASYRLERPRVSASGLLGEYQGIAIDLPNPHVVVELADLPSLQALALWQPPRVAPALPDGQNVEFVVRTDARRLSMRVHERGVGETRSCGTGICAAVVAAAGDEAGEGQWLVDVLGGRCTVGWTAGGSVILTGPAVLVAEVQLGEQWLAEHR